MFLQLHQLDCPQDTRLLGSAKSLGTGGFMLGVAPLIGRKTEGIRQRAEQPQAGGTGDGDAGSPRPLPSPLPGSGRTVKWALPLAGPQPSSKRNLQEARGGQTD